ncbi:MAG TPA: hypothetical protein VN892_09795 [Solirubrobacteraceae bacterium]|nr:hypothetical protein [Solirubrobacteraceae bacterium]
MTLVGRHEHNAASVRREAGQLLDYSRFVEPTPHRSVLLPFEPSRDLQGLSRVAGVDLVWRDGKGFAGLAGPI